MAVRRGVDNPLLRGLPLLGDLPGLEGASVLVRVDFNVPLREGDGGLTEIADDFRIRAALPTLQYLLDRGATVTACTHLGRPEGAPDVRWELAPVREELALLAPKVELLENLRFDPGEEHNDPAFVEKLVNSHDIYVNDAFGVSHRRHASVVGPPTRLPSAAGFLLERELDGLGTLLGAPDRPFVAVVGGAKVADKLGVLESLLERVDALLVGGGMAFTFLAAAGHSVGGSLVDPDRIEECGRLLRSTDKIHLPSDLVALEPGAEFGCGCVEGKVRHHRSGGSRGMARARHRSRNGGRLCEDDRRCRQRALERADGCVRRCPVLTRDGGYRQGGGGVSRLHRHRRRRQRSGRGRARAHRSGQLHLDRRRCRARAPRAR